MSQAEFDSIPAKDHQALIEGSQKLLAHYGPEWFRRERPRLREEARQFFDAELAE